MFLMSAYCFIFSFFNLSVSLAASHTDVVVSAYRYIATATLAITAVFLEYLRPFLIDLHQIYRHNSVPKTRLRAFFELLISTGFRAWRRCDFFCHVVSVAV